MSQQKEETPIPPLSTKSSQIEQVDQVAEQAPVVETAKPVDSTSEEVFLNVYKPVPLQFTTQEFDFKFKSYDEIVKIIESDAYVAKLKREFAEMDDNNDKKYTIEEVR